MYLPSAVFFVIDKGGASFDVCRGVLEALSITCAGLSR